MLRFEGDCILLVTIAVLIIRYSDGDRVDDKVDWAAPSSVPASGVFTANYSLIAAIDDEFSGAAIQCRFAKYSKANRSTCAAFPLILGLADVRKATLIQKNADILSAHSS